MMKALWVSIHYLYDDTNISYTQLFVAANKAETEVIVSKKSATTKVVGTVGSSSSKETQNLPNRYLTSSLWYRVLKAKEENPAIRASITTMELILNHL